MGGGRFFCVRSGVSIATVQMRIELRVVRRKSQREILPQRPTENNVRILFNLTAQSDEGGVRGEVSVDASERYDAL